MTFELGGIADDLTGGMMMASLLEREGVTSPLITATGQLASIAPDAEAVVYANKFRLIPAQDARNTVSTAATALRDAGAKHVYYKYCATFDSTDEGNIGPCGEALMDALGGDRMIFCPAFPESWVTVFQGHMFIASRLLSDTFKQHDPVTPMTDADLVRVLQKQTSQRVGLLTHKTMDAGLEAARKELDAKVKQGTPLFIVDSTDDDDVLLCAELASEWPCSSGADALPVFLARVWQRNTPKRDRPLRTDLDPAPGLEAVIAGSCAPATLKQLEYFEQRHPLFRMNLLDAAEDDNYTDRVLEWASTQVKDGPVGIATSEPLDSLAKIQQALGRSEAAALADKLVGQIAEGLYGLGVRKYVVAGGETSGAVFNALNIEKVDVSAFDDLGGGYCHAEKPEPISLLLKAGGIGTEDLYFRGLDRMRGSE